LQVLRRALGDMLAGLGSCAEQPQGGWWCEDEFIARGGDDR
jgi:hypothetical protein